MVQSSKFELVVDAETARMLGLAVPPFAAGHCRQGDRVSFDGVLYLLRGRLMCRFSAAGNNETLPR